MKYMICWSERPQGSAIEYENAQKRILEVFTVAGRCFDQLALALSPISDGGVYSCAPEKTAGGKLMATECGY